MLKILWKTFLIWIMKIRSKKKIYPKCHENPPLEDGPLNEKISANPKLQWPGCPPLHPSLLFSKLHKGKTFSTTGIQGSFWELISQENALGARNKGNPTTIFRRIETCF